MTRPISHQPDPKLDLVLERIVDVPRELVWGAWTNPGQLKQWFAPDLATGRGPPTCPRKTSA